MRDYLIQETSNPRAEDWDSNQGMGNYISFVDNSEGSDDEKLDDYFAKAYTNQ